MLSSAFVLQQLSISQPYQILLLEVKEKATEHISSIAFPLLVTPTGPGQDQFKKPIYQEQVKPNTTQTTTLSGCLRLGIFYWANMVQRVYLRKNLRL